MKAAVFRQNDDMPDQTGRVVLVTGANSGLGLRTAEGLARRGAKVLLDKDFVDKHLTADQLIALSDTELAEVFVDLTNDLALLARERGDGLVDALDALPRGQAPVGV